MPKMNDEEKFTLIGCLLVVCVLIVGVSSCTYKNHQDHVVRQKIDDASSRDELWDIEGVEGHSLQDYRAEKHVEFLKEEWEPKFKIGETVCWKTNPQIKGMVISHYLYFPDNHWSVRSFRNYPQYVVRFHNSGINGSVGGDILGFGGSVEGSVFSDQTFSEFELVKDG